MIKDRELKLLVGLCASAIRGEQFEGVGDHDWQRLHQLARRHRVQGLAWLGLTGGRESELSIGSELFEETKSIAHDNLLGVAAAARLREEFQRDGLPVIFLKGLTLGALTYRQAMLKLSTDVDLLVDSSDIDAAEHCLLRLGYRPEGRRRSQSPRGSMAKEWTWVGSDVQVDLHTRLADNPKLLPSISARSPTQEVEVSPGILLPTFQREQLFAYLCVHGASSAWFRLKWVADLAAFLHRSGADEIRHLYHASLKLGAGRCPDVTLLVVEQIFGPLVPADLLASAARDPGARLLANFSIRELTHLREPLERPLGTVLIHLVQLFADRGFAFPLREFQRQFSALVA